MIKLSGKVVFIIAAFAMILSSAARADVVDFQDQVGPSNFNQVVTSPQTLVYNFGSLSATFTGGVILTNTSNLPANQTSLYGAADFGTGLSNPLTITFSSAVTNVFFDLYNGLTTNIDYLISDNASHSATFNLAPNLSSGTTLVGFAATGTVITIASTTPPTSTFDFFIDNIHFNEALPPTLAVPEPEIYAMLATGLGLMGWVGRRRKQSAV